MINVMATIQDLLATKIWLQGWRKKHQGQPSLGKWSIKKSWRK